MNQCAMSVCIKQMLQKDLHKNKSHNRDLDKNISDYSLQNEVIFISQYMRYKIYILNIITCKSLTK